MLWILKIAAVIICLVIFIKLISAREFFQCVINRDASCQDKLMVIILFGIFPVFFTYMGSELPTGAIVNVRDIAPMIAGFVNLWVLRQKSGDKIIKIHWAVLFAVIMALFHRGLILLIVQPLDAALSTVETIALSMTIANAIGGRIGTIPHKKVATIELDYKTCENRLILQIITYCRIYRERLFLLSFGLLNLYNNDNYGKRKIRTACSKSH